MREPRIDPKPPARRSSDGPRFVLDFDVLHEGQPQRLVSVEFTFSAWQTFASALNTPDSDTTLLEPIMTNWGREVIAEWPKAGPELPPSITLHTERWQDPTHRGIAPLNAQIMLGRWGLLTARAQDSP